MDYKLPTINEVLANPATSFWLANALTSALGRDCVDAANDAAFMADLLAAKAKAWGNRLVRARGLHAQ